MAHDSSAHDITGKTVAFLLTDGYEDSELTEPWKAVVDAGGTAVLVSPICHGAWILIEADVVTGRELTSYPSLRTDLLNAGAEWVDEEVVVDAGLVSSRTPDDLPAFCAKLVEEVDEGEHAGQTA